MLESLGEADSQKRAAVLPAGGPIATCIVRALEKAGFSTHAVESEEGVAADTYNIAEVTVFLLGEPGGVAAVGEYISALRALGAFESQQKRENARYLRKMCC